MSAVVVIIEECDKECMTRTDDAQEEIFEKCNKEQENNMEKFPYNSDDEFDTDIEIEEKKDIYDATGCQAYLDACVKLETSPVSFFLKHMKDKTINLQYRSVGPVGIKAIAASLIVNTVTLQINLMENYIGDEGAKVFCEMLKENCYLSDINLSMNNLGSEGCRHICEMLQHNIHLSKLDVSKNNFGDSVGQYIADGLKNNFKLSSLNISGNNLGEKVGILIGPAVSKSLVTQFAQSIYQDDANDAIETLNLSWNQLREKATKEIAIGLRANCTLKVLNLAWNGFSNQGALDFADALKVNNTLLELDLSNNRIGLNGALVLAKCLEANNTLEVLKMNGNPITCKGAMAILMTISNNADSAMREFHTKDVEVDEEFKDLYERIKQAKEVIVHATFRMPLPLKRLQNFVKKNQLDWLAVFEEMDELRTCRVTKKEFLSGLQKLGFDFTIDEKASLFRKLITEVNDRINYKDILLGFSNYVAPSTPLPKSAKEKGKAKTKGKNKK